MPIDVEKVMKWKTFLKNEIQKPKNKIEFHELVLTITYFIVYFCM